MDKYEIGMKLKKIRMSKNISQEDVAAFLNSTPQKISSFETGRTRISLESFISLCELYGISPDAFFDLPNQNLSSKEYILINIFRSLNEEGQDKLIDNGRDLVATGRYKKNNEIGMVGEKQA